MLAVAVLAVGAVLAAAFSPPGHAVFERVRRAVGIEHAASALAALPAPGGCSSNRQPERGSSSPTGRSATLARGRTRRGHRTAALSWSPSRTSSQRSIRTVRCAGRVCPPRRRMARVGRQTKVDTRIAYFAASGLRVVAGDGTGDKLLDAYAQADPAAWDPAQLHTLAYETGGAVVLRQVDPAASPVACTCPRLRPTFSSWSSDGKRLAVVSPPSYV